MSLDSKRQFAGRVQLSSEVDTSPALANSTCSNRRRSGGFSHGTNRAPTLDMLRRQFLSVLGLGLVTVACGAPDPDDEFYGIEQESVAKFKLATYNCPGRYSVSGRRKDLNRLRDKGVSIIAVQENPDGDPAKIKPNGWAHYRPAVAQSAAMIWNPHVWRVIQRGRFKLSSRGDPVAPRYIVWVFLEHRKTKRRVKVGSLHLPAFKTSRPKNAKEFRHQEKRAAEWLSRGPRRVLMGDFNANVDGSWMSNMREVGVHHTPVSATGPHNSKIDHVWRPKGQPRPDTVGTMKGVSDHKALIVRL